MHRLIGVLRTVLGLVLAGAQAKASGLCPQEARPRKARSLR